MKDLTPERYEPGNYKASPIAYEHWHRYLSIASLVKDKIVLDIACGNGYGSNYLSSFAKKVIGVDIDESAINLCRKNYISDSVEYRVGSVSEIRLEDDSVDVVVSFETIEHVAADAQDKFMREAHRVLKPDGVLVISTPNIDSSQYTDVDNKFHIKEFKHKEFLGFCKKYFRTVSALGQSILIGSIISRINAKESGLGLLKVNYDRQGVPEILDGSVEDKFIIAICSDNKQMDYNETILWDLENSFMTESYRYIDSLQVELLKQKRDAKLQIDELKKSVEVAEVYAASLAQDRESVRVAYGAEQEARERERGEAEKQLAAVVHRVETAESYARSLLENRDKLYLDYENERNGWLNEREEAQKQIEMLTEELKSSVRR